MPERIGLCKEILDQMFLLEYSAQNSLIHVYEDTIQVQRENHPKTLEETGSGTNKGPEVVSVSTNQAGKTNS